jgi:hypothetical protein
MPVRIEELALMFVRHAPPLAGDTETRRRRHRVRLASDGAGRVEAVAARSDLI